MYIAIGKIVRTHGLRGYLKAICYSGLPDRFISLKTIYFEIDLEMHGFILDNIQPQNRVTLLKLRGIDRIESAAQFVKKEIWVPEGQKISLPEKTYFIHELIGLQVFDITGNYLGSLDEVLQNAGNDVYVIRNEQKELLIPAVSEFVKEVNIAENKMIVRLIEGMVD